MKRVGRLIDRASGRVVVERLEIADRFLSRLVGLQLRAEPPPGSGLLLAPCPSIHTSLMRFPLDLAMLDRDGRVVEVRRGVRPWRALIPARPTFAILEVPAGGLAVDIGERLRLEAPDADRRLLSKALAAWCFD